jgi:hypothetical protein
MSDKPTASVSHEAEAEEDNEYGIREGKRTVLLFLPDRPPRSVEIHIAKGAYNLRDEIQRLIGDLPGVMSFW